MHKWRDLSPAVAILSRRLHYRGGFRRSIGTTMKGDQDISPLIVQVKLPNLKSLALTWKRGSNFCISSFGYRTECLHLTQCIPSEHEDRFHFQHMPTSSRQDEMFGTALESTSGLKRLCIMCNYSAMDGIRANASTLEEFVYVAKEFSSFLSCLSIQETILPRVRVLSMTVMAFDIPSLTNLPAVFPCLQFLSLEIPEKSAVKRTRLHHLFTLLPTLQGVQLVSLSLKSN